MRRSPWKSMFLVAALAAAALFLSRGQSVAQEGGPPKPAPEAVAPGSKPADAEDADEPDIETLTRGPIHEAFAEEVNLDPKPGMLVPKAPPEAIKEIPPDVKPDDENVQWVPGYWTWDDDKADYIWTSGVWRKSPPGQRWVTGYWSKVTQTDGTDAYQWVPGFWAPADSENLGYMEPPPDSKEEGPTSPAPGDNYFWVPGCWNYGNSGYGWTPGYWANYYPNWLWIPNSYIWTPRGCLFRRGYWDYRLANRGYLFAPVYFRRPIYLNPGYRYSPRCLIGQNALAMHMFGRPNYNHYYFGNYYGQNSFHHISNFHGNGRMYDPLYVHNQVRQSQSGVNYGQRMSGWNTYYTQHPDMRPANTLAGQQQFQAQHAGHAQLTHSLVATPLHQAVSGQNFAHLSLDARQGIARTTGQLQTAIAQQRTSALARPGASVGSGTAPGGKATTGQIGHALHLPADPGARAMSRAGGSFGSGAGSSFGGSRAGASMSSGSGFGGSAGSRSTGGSGLGSSGVGRSSGGFSGGGMSGAGRSSGGFSGGHRGGFSGGHSFGGGHSGGFGGGSHSGGGMGGGHSGGGHH